MLRKIFQKDLTKVLLSSFASQGINIFTSLFLARFLSISQIGIIAGITAMVSLVGGIGCLRYNQAILIAENKEECDTLFTLSLLISLFFFFFFLFGIIGTKIIKPELISEYGPYIYIAPLWSLTSIFSLTLNEVNVFHKRFDLFSKNNLLKAIVAFILHLPVVVFSNSILIPLLGKLLSELVYFKGNFKINIIKDFKKLATISKKYNQFPIHETPIQLMLLISKNAIFFAYSFYYSNYALGLFSMAYRIFKIPHLIIGENVRRVIELKLKSKNSNEVFYYINKTFLSLLAVSIILSVITYFSIPFVIPILLGKKWLKMAGYVYAFIPLIILTLSIVPFLAYFKINGRLGIISFNNFLQLIALIGCILIASRNSTPLEFALYYSLTSSICMTIIIVQYYYGYFRYKRLSHG